jgi:hypothetical protein
VITLTNVGSAYDAIALSQGLWVKRIDFTGVTQLKADLRVNKIGTGTQSWQIWNDTDGAQIGVIDDAGAAGVKSLAATFNVSLTGEKVVRVRAKSTIAADDPVFLACDLTAVRPARSFERVYLLDQVQKNTVGLTHNMRDNATGYKAALLAPFNQTPAQVATVMKADADRYLVRTGWLTDLLARNATLAADTLADAGLTVAQTTALRDTLAAVANHTKAATLTTAAQVNAEADYILANVPVYERLW